MIVALLLAVLALFDAALAGFRAAAGREGVIDKGSYFRAALLRGFTLGIGLVALNAALIALLVVLSPDRAAAWAVFVRAGTTCVWIFAAFAALTLAAIAFWFAPKPDYRVIATIIVLGPLTLLRPFVIVGGLATAVALDFDVRVLVAAGVAAISMLSFEFVIGRAHATRWQRLLIQLS